MDIQSLARSDRGLWRVVGPAAPGVVSFPGFKRADMVSRILRAGTVLQLSALHGDDLPRLPPRGRLSQVSDIHGSHHRASRTDSAAVASLAAHSALDFHHLPDLESVALQRPELWTVHDVRAPGRRRSQQIGSAGFVRSVYRVVLASVPGLSYGPVDRPSIYFAGN